MHEQKDDALGAGGEHRRFGNQRVHGRLRQRRLRQQRLQPHITEAAPGGAGLATLLAVTLAQVHAGTLTLAQVLTLLTAGPARFLGIDAGVLRKGAPADLCLFDPRSAWRVEAGKLPGKAQNTPFDGRALEGKVIGTWKAGRRVFA